MGLKRVVRKELLIGRLRHGADLLEEITAVCRENDIRLGWISAMGAVRKARIASYDQDRREYEYLELDEPLELTSLAGNVSLKDGQPMVHAHVVFADASGRACGGHLAPGTIIFACELTIEVLDGVLLEREPDAETGLPLWR